MSGWNFCQSQNFEWGRNFHRAQALEEILFLTLLHDKETTQIMIIRTQRERERERERERVVERVRDETTPIYIHVCIAHNLIHQMLAWM